MPTIYTNTGYIPASVFPTPTSSRNPPSRNVTLPDQINDFDKQDVINNLSDITKDLCPEGYEYKRSEEKVIFYKLSDGIGSIPFVSEAIAIDEKLHVKLILSGSPIPLPQWFVNGKTRCLATRKSVIQNFPSYIKKFHRTKRK